MIFATPGRNQSCFCWQNKWDDKHYMNKAVYPTFRFELSDETPSISMNRIVNVQMEHSKEKTTMSKNRVLCYVNFSFSTNNTYSSVQFNPYIILATMSSANSEDVTKCVCLSVCLSFFLYVVLFFKQLKSFQGLMYLVAKQLNTHTCVCVCVCVCVLSFAKFCICLQTTMYDFVGLCMAMYDFV